MTYMLTEDKVMEMIDSGISNPFLLSHLCQKYGLGREMITTIASQYGELICSDLENYAYEPLVRINLFPDHNVELDGEKKAQLIADIDSLIYKERQKVKPFTGIHRFKNRSEGRRLKKVNPFLKLYPYIMKERSDAHIFSKFEWDAEEVDAYIKQKRKEGLKLSYLHVFIALLVRILALRPTLNRFIMANRIYARNDISVTFVIMKSLRDDSDETVLKFSFTGNESIYDIYYKIDEALKESLKEKEETEVDKIIDVAMSWPNPLLSFVAGCIRWLDKLNMIPKNLVKASPFHSSIFITYLKSLKLDYVYHHIYNFGSTSLFFALGKDTKKMVYRNRQMEAKKICEVGVTIDERIGTGLYIAHTMRLVKKYTQDLYKLDTRLREVLEDID